MQTKLLVSLGLVLLTASIASYGYASKSESSSVTNEFTQWKAQNNKYYSEMEELYRFKVFSDNLKFVKQHNLQQQYTFTLAMNNFADLTNDEFTQKYLTINPVLENREVKTSSGVSIPDTWEWSTKITIRYKNQGACSSGWAQTGIDGLEAAHAIAGNAVFLSEQELIDCAHLAGFESDGCKGGWVNDVFSYSEKFGVADLKVYPYIDEDGICDQTLKPRYYSKSHVLVQKQNAQALKEGIAQNPVSVVINARGITFQLYKSGIYSKPCPGDEDSLNHYVLATGYDNIQKFYNIKNSWGQTWGEKGYIRLGYVDAPEGQCGVQQMASYPTV